MQKKRELTVAQSFTKLNGEAGVEYSATKARHCLYFLGNAQRRCSLEVVSTTTGPVDKGHGRENLHSERSEIVLVPQKRLYDSDKVGNAAEKIPDPRVAKVNHRYR